MAGLHSQNVSVQSLSLLGTCISGRDLEKNTCVYCQRHTLPSASDPNAPVFAFFSLIDCRHYVCQPCALVYCTNAGRLIECPTCRCVSRLSQSGKRTSIKPLEDYSVDGETSTVSRRHIGRSSSQRSRARTAPGTRSPKTLPQQDSIGTPDAESSTVPTPRGVSGESLSPAFSETGKISSLRRLGLSVREVGGSDVIQKVGLYSLRDAARNLRLPFLSGPSSSEGGTSSRVPRSVSAPVTDERTKKSVLGKKGHRSSKGTSKHHLADLPLPTPPSFLSRKEPLRRVQRRLQEEQQKMEEQESIIRKFLNDNESREHHQLMDTFMEACAFLRTSRILLPEIEADTDKSPSPVSIQDAMLPRDASRTASPHSPDLRFPASPAIPEKNSCSRDIEVISASTDDESIKGSLSPEATSWDLPMGDKEHPTNSISPTDFGSVSPLDQSLDLERYLTYSPSNDAETDTTSVPPLIGPPTFHFSHLTTYEDRKRHYITQEEETDRLQLDQRNLLLITLTQQHQQRQHAERQQKYYNLLFEIHQEESGARLELYNTETTHRTQLIHTLPTLTPAISYPSKPENPHETPLLQDNYPSAPQSPEQ